MKGRKENYIHCNNHKVLSFQDIFPLIITFSTIICCQPLLAFLTALENCLSRKQMEDVW